MSLFATWISVAASIFANSAALFSVELADVSPTSVAIAASAAATGPDAPALVRP